MAFESYATVRIRGAVLNSPTPSRAQLSLHKRLHRERGLLAEQIFTRTRTGTAAELRSPVGLAISYMLEARVWSVSSATFGRWRDAYSSIEQRQLADALGNEALPILSEGRSSTAGLSFTHVAEILGVTKGRVSQIHRQALQLIREAHAVDSQLDLSG